MNYILNFELYTEDVKDVAEMSGVVNDLSGAGLSFSKEWAHGYFNTKAPENDDDKFGGGGNPFNVAD